MMEILESVLQNYLYILPDASTMRYFVIFISSGGSLLSRADGITLSWCSYHCCWRHRCGTEFINLVNMLIVDYICVCKVKKGTTFYIALLDWTVSVVLYNLAPGRGLTWAWCKP